MSKEITNVLSQDQLELIKSMTPSSDGFTRILLPRFGMYSQDKFEGKGKNAKLIKEAGMFYVEKETDEVDAEGKKIWETTELGTEAEGIILYHRKQLSYYDEATEKYTSSPVYDSPEDIIPLFCDKKEIARGTPNDLKSLYAYKDEDGKVKSHLEEQRILYILRGDEVYQMNLRGSSMFSFLTYSRSLIVPTVLTGLNSEPKEKGSISWNQMVFTKLREITPEEASLVIEKVSEIKEGIRAEKEYYASLTGNSTPKETEEKEDWSVDESYDPVSGAKITSLKPAF